jgi:hypothetical protein
MAELSALVALEVRALWRVGSGWLCIGIAILVAIASAQQPDALARQGVRLDLTAWAGVGAIHAVLVPLLWISAMPDRDLRTTRPSTVRTASVLSMMTWIAIGIAVGGLVVAGPAFISVYRNHEGPHEWQPMAGAAVCLLALGLTTASTAASIPARERRRLAFLPLLTACAHGWAVGLPSEIIERGAVGAQPVWAVVFAVGACSIATAVAPPRSSQRGAAPRTAETGPTD